MEMETKEDCDTQRLISEVKSRPALWDPGAANRLVRLKAWDQLCKDLYPEYETANIGKKTRMCRLLQRKWKSLRDSYTRELNFQLKLKPGKSDRKRYVHYESLDFLRHVAQKRKKLSTQDKGPESPPETGLFEDLEMGTTGADQHYDGYTKDNSQSPHLPKISKVRSLQSFPYTKDPGNKELDMLKDLSERLSGVERVTKNLREDFEDPDRMFLLSLLNDIKKVGENDRLQMKSEIIMTIAKWQSKD